MTTDGGPRPLAADEPFDGEPVALHVEPAADVMVIGVETILDDL